MEAENIIKIQRFNMADDNIIKKDRFKMAAETSPYIALSSDGGVSSTLYDDFFTDAKERVLR